jgi:hypothetical protein
MLLLMVLLMLMLMLMLLALALALALELVSVGGACCGGFVGSIAQVSVLSLRIQATRVGMLLVIGYWLLVIGYWLLVIGYDAFGSLVVGGFLVAHGFKFKFIFPVDNKR